jgi:RHS repeat-associated protein
MTYSYDTLGNILYRQTEDASGLPNPPQEFYEKWFSTASFDPAHPHRLLAVGGDTAQSATLLYDAAGNVTELRVVNGATGRDTTFSYEWDHYHRLVTARRLESGGGGTSGAEVVAEHRYDAGNSRVLKGVASLSLGLKTAVYVTQGFELRDEQDVKYVFSDTARIAKIDSSGWWTFAHDHLQTTSLVASWAGNVASTTTHLPFGAIEVETGSVDEPYKFTGKELEREFGLYYFGARYYNPHLGRWMSVDPLSIRNIQKRDVATGEKDGRENRTGVAPSGKVGRTAAKKKVVSPEIGKNGYEYVENNPLRKVDPDGNDPRDVCDEHMRTTTPEQRRKALENTKEFLNKRARASKFVLWYAKGVAKGLVAGGVAALSVISGKALSAARAAAGRKIAAWLIANHPRVAGVLFGASVAARGSSRACNRLVPKIGRKLDYFFGRATGSAHNIERSRSMLRTLRRIGINDTATGRVYLREHFAKVLNDPTNIVKVQRNSRVVKESLLMGPKGGVKVRSIWEGAKLITATFLKAKH